MKNIEKKWMLFLIATFVTFLGIGYNLLKGTQAATEVIDNADKIVVEDTNISEAGIGDVIIESPSDSITDLILSEGTIDFDPNVMEYTITVTDFEKLDIVPIFETSVVSYMVDKKITDNEKSVVITVNSNDGNDKVYTINVLESNESLSTDKENKEKDNINYNLIFIALICILVLINIYRIIKNKRK